MLLGARLAFSIPVIVSESTVRQRKQVFVHFYGLKKKGFLLSILLIVLYVVHNGEQIWHCVRLVGPPACVDYSIDFPEHFIDCPADQNYEHDTYFFYDKRYSNLIRSIFFKAFWLQIASY